MSDICQTPECGHGRASHDPRSGWCHYPLNECLCTRYIAPDGTLERGRQLASERDDLIAQGADAADLAVPLAGILPEKSDTAPTETVSESCPNHGCHDWRCESCKHPTREQVLADEQAAWDAFKADNGIGEERFWEREAHRFGYLAGKGITE